MMEIYLLLLKVFVMKNYHHSYSETTVVLIGE